MSPKVRHGSPVLPAEMHTFNAEIPDHLLNTRCVTLIPKRPDGSGVVALGMVGGNMRHFGFDVADIPADALVPSTGGQVGIALRTIRANFGGSWYRIATRFRDDARRPEMWSFRLSSEHNRDTLQWITNHLNSTGVEWLYLCNKHGNPLSRSSFRSV